MAASFTRGVSARAMAGELMSAEMAEQPAVLARMLSDRTAVVQRLRAAVPDRPRGTILVARGSSDHAAIYGRYLLEHTTGYPVSLAAPSLVTRYGVGLNVTGWLVVAVSQSGRTPEVVDVARRLAASGAQVVAVTNEADSPLAEAADGLVLLEAGTERAIPATKTFTAQLLAMALIADALGGVPWPAAAWDRLPGAVEEVLEAGDAIAPAVEILEGCTGLVVAGRGFLLAAALETALKIKECAALLAQGYSTADLRHGPIAVVERDFPALVLSARGATEHDTTELVARLRDRGAAVVEVGQRDASEVAIPAGLPDALTPFAAAVRGQQIALAAALRRGLDPDHPEGLSKVTETR